MPTAPQNANPPADIDQLVNFCLECGAEEMFAEPVNARGSGLGNLADRFTANGYLEEAGAMNKIKVHAKWSAYAAQLLRDIQTVLRSRGALDKLRFLLYSSSLTPQDREAIQLDDAE